MRNAYWYIALLFVVLAGCGRDDTAATGEVADPAADELVDEAPAEPMPEPPEDNEDEAVVVVEESSAEAEESADQPILLARAEDAAAAREWQFKEGQHFTRLVPSQPTVGGADKIEVAEFFWYGCAHCNDFESYINEWDEDKPANVRFVRIHPAWNRLLKLHQQMYYTEQALVRSGAIEDPATFRSATFKEIHGRGNQLASVDAIRDFFERQGVSNEDFDAAWKLFSVDQNMRLADDLTQRYGISGVPAMVVNGKYVTAAREAGSYPKLIEVIEELVERESVR